MADQPANVAPAEAQALVEQGRVLVDVRLVRAIDRECRTPVASRDLPAAAGPSVGGGSCRKVGG